MCACLGGQGIDYHCAASSKCSQSKVLTVLEYVLHACLRVNVEGLCLFPFFLTLNLAMMVVMAEPSASSTSAAASCSSFKISSSSASKSSFWGSVGWVGGFSG
jgi:hypothetical protein